MAECNDQLEEGEPERAEGRLALDPRFGVGEGFEDASAVPGGTLDDPLVDEKEQHGGRLPERELGPEWRATQVDLQMQSDITRRFLDQRRDVLIVPMAPVMGQTAVPSPTQKTGEFG